jgi:hypothetical protein
MIASMRLRKVESGHLVVVVLAALLVIGAAGRPAPALAQAAAPAKAAPILDRQQLGKVLKKLDETGRTRAIPAKVTAALGATKGEETLDVREIAFQRAEYEHGFYKPVNPSDDRIILAFRTPEKKWSAFLTDSRLGLIAAISWNAGDAPVRWEGAEAQQAFDNELAYWAILAETF